MLIAKGIHYNNPVNGITYMMLICLEKRTLVKLSEL